MYFFKQYLFLSNCVEGYFLFQLYVVRQNCGEGWLTSKSYSDLKERRSSNIGIEGKCKFFSLHSNCNFYFKYSYNVSTGLLKEEMKAAQIGEIQFLLAWGRDRKCFSKTVCESRIWNFCEKKSVLTELFLKSLPENSIPWEPYIFFFDFGLAAVLFRRSRYF